MIDWARIAELRDEFGAEDFDEIVELFLTEVETAIAAYDGSDADPTSVEEQMHFLKGAALNLGFADLAALCFEGEKAASTGDASAVSPQAVCLCFDNSKAVFAGEYRKRFAA